jgi:hypothetical protein
VDSFWQRVLWRTPPRFPPAADPLTIVHGLHALADEATPRGVIRLAQRDVRLIADTIADLVEARGENR